MFDAAGARFQNVQNLRKNQIARGLGMIYEGV